MKGEDKAIEIIQERLWELKKVGVNMFLLGHTKSRTMTDIMTGLEYDMLTTNMPHRYFNAFKTKLHVLGVASIDRSIKSETIQGKAGKTQTIGKITDESRIITFRDNNFNIDSKSRFSEIIPSIPLDADSFIGAINDAIKKEHEKQGGSKSIEETKMEQQQESETKVNEYIDSKSGIDVAKNEAIIESIKSNITQMDAGKMQEIMAKYGITDFTNPAEIETKALEEIAALV